MELHGSYYALSRLPAWASATLFLTLTMVAKWAISWQVRGYVIDASASSLFGDIALFFAFMIGATVVARKEPVWPGAFKHSGVQAGIFFVLVVIGAVICLTTLKARSGGFPDIYHDFVLVPIYAYFALTLAPMICASGTKVEQFFALAFGALWVFCVYYDFAQKRIDQLTFLWEQKGVFIPLQ